MNDVLFASSRPLGRAENIKSVFDAYDGDKDFIQLKPFRDNDELVYDKYKLLVTDEFVTRSPKKCIMIQHGLPSCKTFGLDQPVRYHDKKWAKLMTYVITSSDSEYIIEQVAHQSGVSEDQVLPLGMPRTDKYFGATRTLTGQKNYLYVPTYRAWYEGIDPIKSTNWKLIDELLTDNEIMIVKAHMLDRDPSMEGYKHIIMASNEEPSADYLINADVVITDYSSIMMDGYLMGKPCVLFAKDKGRYLSQRGMYFIYPDNYSDYFTADEEELVELIRTAQYTELNQMMMAVIANKCDGHSTERVVNLIKEMVNDD